MRPVNNLLLCSTGVNFTTCICTCSYIGAKFLYDFVKLLDLAPTQKMGSQRENPKWRRRNFITAYARVILGKGIVLRPEAFSLISFISVVHSALSKESSAGRAARAARLSERSRSLHAGGCTLTYIKAGYHYTAKEITYTCSCYRRGMADLR